MDAGEMDYTILIVLLVIGALAAALRFGVRALKRKIGGAAEAMLSLVQEGASTTARIVATERRRMSRGQFEYFVTYAFRDRLGADISKEFRVSATRFDDYKEGQAIDIVYLPRDPTVSATREMVDTVRNTAA